jgi:UDP-N-acetylmuramoyl-tripeptide--D-alanyl-D-alanine ligase
MTIIGITGSNGKTTTKELIRAVLSQKYRTFATQGNLNNHIGVPLTLLSMPPDTEMGVVEMGANHQGEIRELSNICMPDFGLITNVGKAHLEGFGGFEGVMQGKGELYRHLSSEGKNIFIHSENPYLREMLGNYENIITYGRKSGNYIHGNVLKTSPFLYIEWIDSEGKRYVTDTHLAGEYNFENILAAICIGHFFGIETEKINLAVSSYTPSNNRSQMIVSGTNTIWLDAYNANPTSTEAALKNFASLNDKKKVVILGDMMELGEESEREHHNIIQMLMKFGFDINILIGSRYYSHRNEMDGFFFKTTSDAREWLSENRFDNACILLKGSRSMKLEDLQPVL